MKHFFNKTFLAILNLFECFRQYNTEWVEDLPEHTNKNVIYIIGGRKYPFYAAFSCPRKKCRKTVYLEVSQKFKKRWSITESKQGRLSLSPSVKIIDSSCKCHYWFKKGHIVWHSVPPLIVPRKNRTI